ncbi:serine/threonine-protein phosphatase [Trifolium pratense]|uniref:Serine/threonine-protein phosphatase n=1 Tax=Trifolium pratense TaxID=57577 RepID=A0A2K3M933_TRIPR|nr:serine/threonine-protein phosphatase [Trifolium pratense]
MIHQQSSELMEVREDFITFRTAHFLKPIANSIHEITLNELKLNSAASSSCSVFEPKRGSFKIRFNGWRYPQTKWVTWVDKLKHKYESVWKKAGIFDAIMSTKSHIMKNEDLVYGVAEKWCCETNTFVFPFGEATITLEDVVVLGGYSLFGDPVFKPLEDQEMREVEQKLIIARDERTVKSVPPSTTK